MSDQDRAVWFWSQLRKVVYLTAGLGGVGYLGLVAVLLSGSRQLDLSGQRLLLALLALVLVASSLAALEWSRRQRSPGRHLLAAFLLAALSAPTQVGLAVLVLGLSTRGLPQLEALLASWPGLVPPSVALGLSFCAIEFVLVLAMHDRLGETAVQR